MNENQFLALLIILAAIGGFLFGYDTGVISGAMVLLKERFDLSDLWQVIFRTFPQLILSDDYCGSNEKR